MAFSLTNFVAQHQRPAVIVPMMATNWAEMQHSIEKMRHLPVDIIEWRVDAALSAGWQPTFTQLQEIVQISAQPILFTWRTQLEGGLAAFDSNAFTVLYTQALQVGVWAIDVEFALCDQLPDIDEWLTTQQVVLSYHHFSRVPNQLPELFDKMTKLQPAVVKIAVTPNTQSEVDALLTLPQIHAQQPSIVIGMGPLGQTTRIHGWRYGSQATFASLDQQHASAPGQLTWQELWAQWQ